MYDDDNDEGYDADEDYDDDEIDEDYDDDEIDEDDDDDEIDEDDDDDEISEDEDDDEISEDEDDDDCYGRNEGLLKMLNTQSNPDLSKQQKQTLANIIRYAGTPHAILDEKKANYVVMGYIADIGDVFGTFTDVEKTPKDKDHEAGLIIRDRHQQRCPCRTERLRRYKLFNPIIRAWNHKFRRLILSRLTQRAAKHTKSRTKDRDNKYTVD